MPNKKHSFSDCSFCGGEVKERCDELDYRYKGKLYIFRDVPTGVCQQCGEKYLTAEIAREIENRIKSKSKWDKSVKVPMEVFSKTGC